MCAHLTQGIGAQGGAATAADADADADAGLPPPGPVAALLPRIPGGRSAGIRPLTKRSKLTFYPNTRRAPLPWVLPPRPQLGREDGTGRRMLPFYATMLLLLPAHGTATGKQISVGWTLTLAPAARPIGHASVMSGPVIPLSPTGPRPTARGEVRPSACAQVDVFHVAHRPPVYVRLVPA